MIGYSGMIEWGDGGKTTNLMYIYAVSAKGHEESKKIINFTIGVVWLLDSSFIEADCSKLV
jgi:hypothetical protein